MGCSLRCKSITHLLISEAGPSIVSLKIFNSRFGWMSSALLLIGSSCSGTAGNARVELSPNAKELIIDGVLDNAVKTSLSMLNLDDVDVVRLRSVGGDNVAAVEIAKILAARPRVAYVFGPCMSACASFLIPIFKRIVVESDGVLVFHHTSSALEKMFSSDPKSTRYLHYHELALNEQTIFAHTALPKIILDFPMVKIEPICFSDIYKNGKWSDAGYYSKYDGLVLSHKALQQIGINVVGGAVNIQDARMRLKHYSDGLLKVNLVFANELSKGDLNYSSINAKLAKVKLCQVKKGAEHE